MHQTATPPPFTSKLDNTIQEGKANLRHYMHVVLERRWLAISAFIVVLVLTGIYLAHATPIYMATARMQINRDSDNPLASREAPAMDSRMEMDYLQTQYRNLQSRTMIEAVARKLNLQDDPRYAQATDKIAAILSDIQVVPVRTTRLVDIRVEHSDPKKAQLIANTLALTFKQANLTRKTMSSFDALTWLQSQESDQRAKVEKAEEALQAYRTSNNEISLEDAQDITKQGLFAAKADLSRAQLDSLSADEVVNEIDAMIAGGKPLQSIPAIRDNVVLLRMRQEIVLKEAALASLLTRYREKHPTVIQARGEIKRLQEQIDEEANLNLESLRNNARIFKKKEEALVAKVAEETRKQQALNQLRIEYDSLKRNSDSSKTIYSQILLRRTETELTSKLTANNIEIVDEAFIPSGPIKPKVALTILFGIFGGALAGIGLAFFVNYLDDSVKSQDDVENTLGLPFLGYVPNIRANSVVERDLQAHSHQQSNAAEGFRTIRATLSLTHKPEKLRLVSVTSTIPSEGKSLVASNLAIVSAQTGLRTLLVDADLRRPSVHKAYQLHSPVGLSAFLTGETSDLNDITHKSEVPNLDVICCGSIPSNPSELIGSARMKAFMELVRDKYDRVVLDCPPISAVSDPLVISANTDGIVFVAKFNKIRREHARRSVQRIQSAGIHVMGVVINDIDFEGKDSYYYSYYYYQNRYYASHYKTGKASDKPAKAEKEKPVETAKS
jgi:capsular exopolysaccharide synthesis family protein